jgi:nitrogen fixation NifU-like protein
MSDIYSGIIMDRYKNPRFRGGLEPRDVSSEEENPLCGDLIRISMRVGEDGRILAALFDGHGCVISQSSADLIAESLTGTTLEEVDAIGKDDVLDLLGIELGPVRLKCALIALRAAKACSRKLREAGAEHPT